MVEFFTYLRNRNPANHFFSLYPCKTEEDMYIIPANTSANASVKTNQTNSFFTFYPFYPRKAEQQAGNANNQLGQLLRKLLT